MDKATSDGDAKRLQGALSKDNARFANPKGPHLFERLDAYSSWIDDRHGLGLWHYTRHLGGPPLPDAKIGYFNRDAAPGINLAVQDYLGLSTREDVAEAAIKAARDFGVHSAGSAMLLGNSPLSAALQTAISELVGMKNVLLFPTGWGAGFGAVKGLVRDYDHIVLDALSHACLQEGAAAATANLHRFRHLDVGSAEAALQMIRAKDTSNSILVITEGIFSMDSDTPDLRQMHELCRSYDATLLVDVAHDLGALGPGGAGELALQGMLGMADIVIGAFSKSFASNGGFVASNDERAIKYLRWFANPHTFSNALSPIQCAVVLKAIEIIRSPEGDELRGKLDINSRAFRKSLIDCGLDVLGSPSAIVPVMIGRESVGRRASKIVNEMGTFTNMIEFPAVGRARSRFRCQLMASHDPVQLQKAASDIVAAIKKAEAEDGQAAAA